MTNRAAKYGDGLFETCKISQGKILFAKDHYLRLATGFSILGYAPISYADFIAKINAHIHTKSDTNLRVRITFFRLGAGLYTPKSNQTDFVIESSPLPSPFYQLNERGLEIGIAKDIHLSTDILSNLKTISALPYVLAGLEKVKNNWDDCLLLNHKKNIAESIAANLFLYYNNTLFTPALSEGCVAGIMRKQVIKIAIKNKIRVVEKSINLSDLKKADTIFLTNAIQGISWVKKIANSEQVYHSKLAIFWLEQINKAIKFPSRL